MAISACGSSDTTANADVMFAQMMIPHHEQALELADLALNPAAGASEAVRELAKQIKSAQDPEIAFMKNWLAEKNEPLIADEGVDHSSMMSGMLTLEDLDSFRTLTGAEFDQAWIAGVIAHHEGAIDMAETVQRDGSDEEIAKLAAAIVAGQSAEIATLKALLT
jgi:uncharacterized protein (DUF305 family)